MLLTVIILVVFIAAAEAVAIVRFAENETDMKDSELLSASLFPLIYLGIARKWHLFAQDTTDDKVNVSMSAINDAVARCDGKFRLTDCCRMAFNASINDDCNMTNNESVHLIDTVNECYGELFVMLNDFLMKKDMTLAVLLHLKIRPKVIGEILHISYSSVRSSKSRLKDKLTQYEDCQLFSTYIDYGKE